MPSIHAGSAGSISRWYSAPMSRRAFSGMLWLPCLFIACSSQPRLPAQVVTSARERRPCSPSSLWGKSGEAWRAEGRLSDYSYAGYRAGESEIPEVKLVANLKADFHAAGDGVTDDSEALIAAIEKAP